MAVNLISGRLIGAFIMALLLLAGTTRLVPDSRFRALPRLCVPITAALFWAVLASILVLTTWDDYYSHFAPSWARWLAPLASLTYFVIALILRWLSLKLPGSSTLNFLLLGGLESIPEHLGAVYGMDIMEIPMFAGSNVVEIFLFAFFEYVIFWALALWLALLAARFWPRREGVPAVQGR